MTIASSRKGSCWFGGKGCGGSAATEAHDGPTPGSWENLTRCSTRTPSPGRMLEKTPAGRGQRLVDALIVWITPARPLELCWKTVTAAGCF